MENKQDMGHLRSLSERKLITLLLILGNWPMAFPILIYLMEGSHYSSELSAGMLFFAFSFPVILLFQILSLIVCFTLFFKRREENKIKGASLATLVLLGIFIISWFIYLTLL